MGRTLKPRRGTTYTMTQTEKRNIVLAKGEFFIEVPNTGIGTGPSIIKIGDGITKYDNLPIAVCGTDVSDVDNSSSTSASTALSNVASGAKISTLFGELKKAISLTINSVNEVSGEVEFPLTIQNNVYGYKKSDGTFVPFVTSSDVSAGVNSITGTAPISAVNGVISHNNSGVTANTYGPSSNVTGNNGATINIPQITVDAKGHVTSVTNRTYTSVNTDTNTTYSGSSPIYVSGTTISHNNSGVTAGTYGPGANVTGSNGATINIPQITVDAKGHVTSVTNRTYTSVDNNTQVSVINNLTSTSTTASLSAAMGKSLNDTMSRFTSSSNPLAVQWSQNTNHLTTATKGNANKPIYLSGGSPVECNTFIPSTGGTFTGNITLGPGSSGQGGKLYVRGIGGDGTNESLAGRVIIGGNTFQGMLFIFDSNGEYYGRFYENLEAISANRNYSLPNKSGIIQVSTSSSRRVKENIKDMTEKEASKLLDVNIVKFDYIGEFGGGLKDQFGVIAEDTVDIIPEAVMISKKYDPNKPVDEDKNPPPSVDYRQFIPYLIKMVQIQEEKIQGLYEEIDELKTELFRSKK